MMLYLFRIWFWIGSWLWPGSAARQAFELFITPQGRVKKKLPAVFEKSTLLKLEESGDRCVGWRWNAGGSPRILILHGFSSAARNFAHLIESFSSAGAEVIAFDAPAHGLSAGKKIHSLRYRKFIQQIRHAYGPFDGYLAHSFGGLSLSLALEELPPRASEKIVLIAPATETRSALRQLKKTLVLRPALLQLIYNLIETRSGHPVSWFSVNRVMQHCSNPVLWIHDRDDDITPFIDIQPTLTSNKPTIQFRITEGLGHRKIYRDAQLCEAMIHFLLNSDRT